MKWVLGFDTCALDHHLISLGPLTMWLRGSPAGSRGTFLILAWDISVTYQAAWKFTSSAGRSSGFRGARLRGLDLEKKEIFTQPCVCRLISLRCCMCSKLLFPVNNHLIRALGCNVPMCSWWKESLQLVIQSGVLNHFLDAKHSHAVQSHVPAHQCIEKTAEDPQDLLVNWIFISGSSSAKKIIIIFTCGWKEIKKAIVKTWNTFPAKLLQQTAIKKLDWSNVFHK